MDIRVVVGDIVLLTLVSFILCNSTYYYHAQANSKGNHVPADIRIVEASSDLRFYRSLTGERQVIAPYFIIFLAHSTLVFDK